MSKIQITHEPAPKQKGVLADPNKLHRILNDPKRAEEYKRRGIVNNIKLDRFGKPTQG